MLPSRSSLETGTLLRLKLLAVTLTSFSVFVLPVNPRVAVLQPENVVLLLQVNPLKGCF